MDSTTRQSICLAASQKLRAAAASIGSIRALIGFDGFVDEIITVVDKRQDSDHYQPIRTIDQFGRKITNAAGQSSNYELIVKQMKLGGNGPIMANALAYLGLDVTYVGNLGYPTLHPVFQPLASHAKVFSIAEPAHTDALEFEDGKLMLGKMRTLRDVNWENINQRIGPTRMSSPESGGLGPHVAGAQLIAMVNWTMLPAMSDIWSNLLAHVLPGLPQDAGARRTIFIDLADPEKRTAGDLAAALRLLTAMQPYVDVMLGLNLKESTQVAHALGLSARSGDSADALDAAASIPESVEQTARQIRAALDLHCVVIHPRHGAAAALRQSSARFDGPFVQQPRISTGAGDHFNAGFCAGRMLGLTLDESLCSGVGVSGYYVRSAASPACQQLSEFLAELPLPQA